MQKHFQFMGTSLLSLSFPTHAHTSYAHSLAKHSQVATTSFFFHYFLLNFFSVFLSSSFSLFFSEMTTLWAPTQKTHFQCLINNNTILVHILNISLKMFHLFSFFTNYLSLCPSLSFLSPSFLLGISLSLSLTFSSPHNILSFIPMFLKDHLTFADNLSFQTTAIMINLLSNLRSWRIQK